MNLSEPDNQTLIPPDSANIEMPPAHGDPSAAVPPPVSKLSRYLLLQPSGIAADWKLVFCLGLLLFAAYLPGLGDYGLYDPWETHYGEVARNMVEHNNYIDPFWGSPWDPDGVKRERAGFYSKPPLIMWMMSAGMNIFGYSELGVRFFFPLVMIMALLAIYLAVSRFFNRRAGLLAVGLTATTPFIAFMSRQAVTDGPLVAIITAGMMCLTLGLFSGEEDEEASPFLYWFTMSVFALVVLGNLWILLPMDRSPDVVRAYPGDRWAWFEFQWWVKEVVTVGAGKGWVVAAFLLPVGAWAALRVARQRRRRMLYVYLFYICCGLVVPAKGWLGWAPMGGAIIAYMIVSGDWKLFSRVDVPTGLLIVFMTGHPWVVAMLAGHHPGWYDRFIIHDHYKRLFAGVHSIDDGAFEYFVQWIGYGLFPWVGLLPAGIILAVSRVRGRVRDFDPAQRFQLLLLLWAVFGFFLFSKSSTKFHHYIFPVIPPLAILSALFIEAVLARTVRHARVFLVCAAALTLWVGQDLYRMPAAYGQGSQQLVNLFTYKYDREWPKYTPPERLEKLAGEKLDAAESDNGRLDKFGGPLKSIAFIAMAGFLLMAMRREWLQEAGTLFTFYAGGWCAIFCLHTYLPDVAQDWSQRKMWATYYEQCSKYAEGEVREYQKHLLETASRIPADLDEFPSAWCREPVVAFRTNWRGETFYSANTVLPAMETKHLKPFLEQWGNEKPFYLFTERSRIRSELEPNLPKHLKGQYKEVFGANRKFVLLRIEKGLGKPVAKEKATQKKERLEKPLPLTGAPK
jgi:4-amino-4-deoxy-L-arabinose transferase-like glycosyltransferase